MQYRDYGDTGYRISCLGFGAMRLPKGDEEGIDMGRSVEIMRHARKLGVNYYDTALAYNKGQSEKAVGAALSDAREDVYIATKVPIHVPKIAESSLLGHIEGQLERLGTDYIDFWHFHDLRFEDFKNRLLPDKDGVMSAARKAREEGLIRHICVSTHAKPEEMLEMLGSGLFEGITLQYNLLDRKNRDVIDYAAEHGIGVIAMGPVGGGQLARPSRRLAELGPDYVSSLPELSLRYVLANPGITCALSGMNTIGMVEENSAAAGTSRPLSEEDLAHIEEAVSDLHRLAELYCTGCGYCMPCPHGVDIPRNFKLMNDCRVYGFEEAAVKGYARLGDGDSGEEKLRASACVECGECRDKCPQEIDIPRQLEEVHKVLGRS